MIEPQASKADLKRIRTCFEHPRPSYSIDEATELLGISAKQIERYLEGGDATSLRLPGEVRIAWADLIVLGLHLRWTLRILTGAVHGSSAADHLPRLVQTVPGTLVLPRYEWKGLDFLASKRRRVDGRPWSVSDLVDEAIHQYHWSSVEWDRIERSAPGIRAAAEWPTTEDVTS